MFDVKRNVDNSTESLNKTPEIFSINLQNINTYTQLGNYPSAKIYIIDNFYGDNESLALSCTIPDYYYTNFLDIPPYIKNSLFYKGSVELSFGNADENTFHEYRSNSSCFDLGDLSKSGPRFYNYISPAKNVNNAEFDKLSDVITGNTLPHGTIVKKNIDYVVDLTGTKWWPKTVGRSLAYTTTNIVNFDSINSASDKFTVAKSRYSFDSYDYTRYHLNFPILYWQKSGGSRFE